jgi:hypothetical protein
MLQPGTGQHQYRDGVQWRAQRLVWSANTSSFYFLLQNSAGRKAYPPSEGRLAQLQEQIGRSVAAKSIPLLQDSNA